MSPAKKKTEQKAPKEQPAVNAGEVKPLTEEELQALQLRIAHMFQPQASNPLMCKLEQIAQLFAAEGKIRG